MASRPTLTDLARELRLPAPIYVTRPTLPPLERFHALLEEIWRTGWLTNCGPLHQRFEQALATYLDAPHLSLFCNGTIALLVALHALRISSGEVITTPFTFPATPHAVHWNGATPVFCDVDPVTLNLDPAGVESLITPRTQAILAVHVYGTPCDTEALERIAQRHGLKVIYDAAHAFGVRLRGRSVATLGDVTMLSFHATKPFSTIEGGALVLGSDAMKRRTDFLKNFGIADEETIVSPGINGKLNEVQSAFGLLHLDMFEREVEARRALARRYRERLAGVPGIRLQDEPAGVESNHAYVPVRVEAATYGVDRDLLHGLLREANVHARKYFHPLCSHIPSYRALPSAAPDRLPVAEQAAREVLCLPIYADLPLEVVDRIVDLLRAVHESARSGTA